MNAILDAALRWLLNSGIQEPSGGVARYYRSDSAKNAPISSEITGYFVSGLAYAHARSGSGAKPDTSALEVSTRAADFLIRDAWDKSGCTFPFEPESSLAYFFDTGIIVRGLLAASRATGDQRFRLRAEEAALSLAFDFLDEGGVFHPVISLPEKQPLPHGPRWSRSPGCYQLKSALAWFDLGHPEALKLFDSVLAYSLATHQSFLIGESQQEKIMDRLHAYCYFLEALLSVADRESPRRALIEGIASVGTLLREIAPVFERSDVCAQLLRLRLIAHHLGAVSLDEKAACEEADRVTSYQAASPDVRIHGGFWFGQRRLGQTDAQVLPFVNPVSTMFCLQALALWQQHRAGEWSFELNQLI